ncbi:PBSX defective prophage terminase (small subunit) [Acetoanaerobium sticklandii]|uniref:PBSX defective prophage terminase (Small subunit) n=1 Tax=Acetoanaerobium sticklandii (strain ATCC 12662 / DSM 519 / JCM 1433 / CCUG 9281 / NCIMB 10654 / HF) TaxID=499177 RepID=E3PRZ8_ACESD|nr:terminase small subunit [Acetoanaerobium sticklandii]CBH21652.1 PBSX defective prophage terminase (small subunit) [Acetoanaerobium sticklandii]
MADIRAPAELAENDYMLGMKYKEIAEKYNVSINTVKSWKKRHDWNRTGVHTKSERVHPKKEVEKPQLEVESEDDSNLTDKQKLFCLYYVKYWNQTKAALKAGYGKDTARFTASNLMKKPHIKKEIDRLKKSIRDGLSFEPMAIFQKYLDIAFSDITDYLEFGREEVPVMGAFGPIEVSVDGDMVPLTKIVNTVKFKESYEVDGTILSEVKQGKDGVSIKLLDKMKALEWLSDRLDFLTDEVRRKLEIETEKVNIAREKLQLEKNKLEGEEELEDDGFLEALKGEVNEVWDDED